MPHVSEAWVVGAFAPAEAQTPESKAAIAVSDQLVAEFLSADRYVFGVPMYNFNIPSTFKAYIDQIVRAGKTFAVGPGGYEGLVTGQKSTLHYRQWRQLSRRHPAGRVSIFRSPTCGIFSNTWA